MRNFNTSKIGSDHGVAQLFRGVTNSPQQAGIEAIVAAYVKSESPAVDSDTIACAELAYALATAYWETGSRMQPVRETFASSDAQAIANLDAAFAKGQMKYVKTPYWKDGWFGRGFVQLTHEANYNGVIRDAVLSAFPGKDIHANPDLAMDINIAAFILIYGMAHGSFTGRSFHDYFVTPRTIDFTNARAIINPGDASSYSKIASIARTFNDAVTAALEK